jgi:hypothetical protein
LRAFRATQIVAMGRAAGPFGKLPSALPSGIGRARAALGGRKMGKTAHMARATWKPHEKHGELTERGDLPDSVFAYPKERKEPMTDASHVRNAVARFDQVEDVSGADRDVAFANIKKAAKHYGVDISESNWSELGSKPRTGLTTAQRKKAAKRGAATRKKRGTGTGSTPARKRGAKRAAATRKANAAKKSTTRKKATTRKKSTARKKSTVRKTSASRKKGTTRGTTRKKTTTRKKRS